MNYSNAMNILDTVNKLQEYLLCFLLFESLPFYNIVEELSILQVLHNKIQFFASLYDFVQLHNIGVSNKLQYVNLSENPISVS